MPRQASVHHFVQPPPPAMLAAAICVAALASCATDPNEGIFVVNGVEMPKLTEARLTQIRSVWTPQSQPRSESTKAGRLIAYWILDLISHSELTLGAPCPTLDLVSIEPREVGLMIPSRSSAGETFFLRAVTYHEAWFVNVCGRRSEWRVLDDTANPQNPLRVLRWGAA